MLVADRLLSLSPLVSFLSFYSSFSFFSLPLINTNRSSPLVRFLNQWSLQMVFNTLISTYGTFVMVNTRLKNGRVENTVRLHAFNYVTLVGPICYALRLSNHLSCPPLSLPRSFVSSLISLFFLSGAHYINCLNECRN